RVGRGTGAPRGGPRRIRGTVPGHRLLLALGRSRRRLARRDRAARAEAALLGVAPDAGPELLVVLVRPGVAPLVDAPLAPLTGADRFGFGLVDRAEVRAELGQFGLVSGELVGRASLRPLFLLGHL